MFLRDHLRLDVEAGMGEFCQPPIRFFDGEVQRLPDELGAEDIQSEEDRKIGDVRRVVLQRFCRTAGTRSVGMCSITSAQITAS